jgi:ribosomal protein S18 acetylase RimI-like enzyme
MPAAPITIRAATRGDTEALIDLKWVINKVEHAAYATSGSIPSVLDLSRDAAAAGVADYWAAIETRGGAMLVGELAGEIVCCGCWYREMGPASMYAHLRDFANIGAIVVLPKARGLGLGKVMMDELERLIVAEGIAHARLIVVPGNAPAEKLYHDLGYEDFEAVMIKPLSKPMN